MKPTQHKVNHSWFIVMWEERALYFGAYLNQHNYKDLSFEPGTLLELVEYKGKPDNTTGRMLTGYVRTVEHPINQFGNPIRNVKRYTFDVLTRSTQP